MASEERGKHKKREDVCGNLDQGGVKVEGEEPVQEQDQEEKEKLKLKGCGTWVILHLRTPT